MISIMKTKFLDFSFIFIQDYSELNKTHTKKNHDFTWEDKRY